MVELRRISLTTREAVCPRQPLQNMECFLIPCRECNLFYWGWLRWLPKAVDHRNGVR